MNALKDLLDEYQNLYTEWCRIGMPDCILKMHQGQGGTAYKKCPKKLIDIHRCCEKGEYIDRLRPWLCYDQANDSLTIYCVYQKVSRKFFSFSVRRSVLSKEKLKSYARKCVFKIDILQGRSSSESRKDAELVVLSGKHSDFIKAGWEKAFQAERNKKEQEITRYYQNCAETAKRLKAQLPKIEKALQSPAMEAMTLYECGHGNEAVFLSNQWYYTLYSHGVMWHNLSGATLYDPTRDSYLSYDSSWFMSFSKIGFEVLQTEDQLFCFSVAMFCRKNGIMPTELTAENLIWNCEIKSTPKGTSINNPRLKPKKEPARPLQSIF